MAHKVIYSRRLIVKGQYNKLLTIRDVFIAGAVSGVTFIVLIVTTPMAVALFGLILMFVLTAALRIQSGIPQKNNLQVMKQLLLRKRVIYHAIDDPIRQLLFKRGEHRGNKV